MSNTRRTFVRMMIVGALVFILVLAGIGVAARMTGESEKLALEYEGFD